MDEGAKGPTWVSEFPSKLVACIALLNTFHVPVFYAPTLNNTRFSKDDIHDVNIKALVEGNTFEFWLPEVKIDPRKENDFVETLNVKKNSWQKHNNYVNVAMNDISMAKPHEASIENRLSIKQIFNFFKKNKLFKTPKFHPPPPPPPPSNP